MAVKNEKGYWRKKDGTYAHPDMVPVDKQLEDELVSKLRVDALNLQSIIKDFKINAFEECYEFNDLLRQKYDMERIVSQSGSVTLSNYDGTAEVQIQVAKLIQFDQKLTLAKEKIDEYLDEKTEHADAEIKTLITRVFDVKNGKVDAKQIMSLKSYPITHPKWVEAMGMIDDSIEIAGTKSYIRFKQRFNGNVDGKLDSIALNIASVVIDLGKGKKSEEASA